MNSGGGRKREKEEKIKVMKGRRTETKKEGHVFSEAEKIGTRKGFQKKKEESWKGRKEGM